MSNSDTPQYAGLSNGIYIRWLRLLVKSPDLPSATRESQDLKGWLLSIAERITNLESKQTDLELELAEARATLERYRDALQWCAENDTMVCGGTYNGCMKYWLEWDGRIQSTTHDTPIEAIDAAMKEGK